MMTQGTILIVEDNLESLRLLSDILGTEDYQVLPANSGELALASVAVRLPDLILLDLHMPGMDGFDVLRQLKAKDNTRDIPVMILSATTETTERVESLRLGAVDFVSKPFQREELLARTKTHLELGLARNRIKQQAADLQTNQIELKMQNESLRGMQAALEESRDRFVDFYEFAPVGYLTITDKGLIADINQTGAALLKMERGKLLQRAFSQFVRAEDAERWYLHLTGLLKQDQKLDCELVLVAADESQVDVRLDSLRLVKHDQPVTVRCVLTDISERKQAEIRLERFFDLIPDLMCIATVGGRFQKINRAWASVLGYTEHELLSSPFIEFVHPDDRAATLDAVSRQLAGEAVLNFVNRYRCKDGRYRWLEWRTTPAIDKALIYATARDVTEVKQMEAVLRQSEARFRQMFQGNDSVMLLVAPDSGQILDANAAAATFYGHSIEHLKAMRIAQISGLSPDELAANLLQASRRERNSFIVPHTLASGEVRTVQVRSSPIEAGADTVIFSIIQDITERVKAEQALLSSEERYRLLIETASEGILVAQGARLKFVNPMVTEITGYTAKELTSRPFLEFIHQDDRELMKANYVKRLNGEALAQKYPIRILPKAAGERWVEISGARIEWDGLPATLNFVTDITERRQAEAELLRSNAELEQFSYAISHDMRQPLRMISSYMQLLETGLGNRLDGEQRDYFDFAIGGAKRLDQMLVGLLDYSRVGRKGETPAWVESHALLDDALLFLRPAIDEAQAVVRVEGEWPRILVSPDEMLRLMQNLLGNAIKFRVAGRIPEIVVTGESTANEWRMSVADNGVGIFAGQIGRLFNVFQRLQSRATYEGNGIGLALCRKIVEHHGGRIWAESAGEGQGSRFCIALPQAGG